MTISAAGHCVKISCGNGFSLIEMLIVILVIGILYSMLGSLLTSQLIDEFGQERERLRAQVQLAQDESAVRSETLGLGFDTQGYGFFHQNGAKWELIAQDRFLGHYSYSNTTAFKPAVFIDGKTIALPAPNGIRPMIFILPTGEMQPFEWRLQTKDTTTLHLAFDAVGQVRADTP